MTKTGPRASSRAVPDARVPSPHAAPPPVCGESGPSLLFCHLPEPPGPGWGEAIASCLPPIELAAPTAAPRGGVGRWVALALFTFGETEA